jgi:hypothetical protein
MSISLRALAGTVVLTGALSLTTTGTAHAISGSFTCGIASFNAVTGLVTGPLCTGGPVTATSGFITSTSAIAPGHYRCDRLSATPMGSFFVSVNGSACVSI